MSLLQKFQIPIQHWGAFKTLRLKMQCMLKNNGQRNEDLFARHQAKRKMSKSENSQNVKKVKETKGASETF